MSTPVSYWRRGLSEQNFGDFLSEFLKKRLFFSFGMDASAIRIIGSCIDDGLIETAGRDALEQGPPAAAKTIYWGCGLRREDGLSEHSRPFVEILSVRGPLTRSALRLGDSVPYGDPALLLPALYRPSPGTRFKHSALLVPHFHDQRNDAQLLAASGCDAVLRPNIAADPSAVEAFINDIVSADFILAASLHAAIVAVAYGRPFAYWDSGNIDLPFKWKDFSASVEIPCIFSPNIQHAKASYHADVQPALRIPILWPSLTVAPFPVRPEALAQIVKSDFARWGPAIWEAGSALASSDRIEVAQQQLLTYLLGRSAALNTVQKNRQELEERLSRETAEHREFALSLGRQWEGSLGLITERHGQALAELGIQQQQVVQTLANLHKEELQRSEERFQNLERESSARVLHLNDELAAARRDTEVLKAQEHAAAVHREGLEKQLEGLRKDGQRLTEELRFAQARLEESQATDRHLAEELRYSQAKRQEYERAFQGVVESKSWKATAPLRNFAKSNPQATKFLHKVAKIIYWLVTFQLLSKLKEKSRIRAEINILRSSPLMDKNWYLTQHSDVAAAKVDPAEHFFWFGTPAGFSPNPLFDAGYYRQRYMRPDADTINPLVHYIRHGAQSGYNPHLLFDSQWYTQHHPEVRERGLDPLLHFLTEGAVAGYAPCPLFDSAWYMEQNEDVRTSGTCPIFDYLSGGWRKGREPHPLFDTQWYQQSVGSPLGDIPPLSHYIECGSQQGFSPHPLFDPRWYQQTGRRGPISDASLISYLAEGREGVGDPNPWFDGWKYRQEYSNAAEFPGAALLHYIVHGTAKDYDPGPWFDSRWYRKSYAALLNGEEPLSHYLRAGIKQGCYPCLLLVGSTDFASVMTRKLEFEQPEDPTVSLIIPVFGRFFDTLRCLHSVLARTAGVSYEVIIADDLPSRRIRPQLPPETGVRIIENAETLGFVRNCNRAAQQARGQYLVFLNNDTVVADNWLAPLVRVVDENPVAGMVGSKLLNYDGSVQEAGGIMFRDGWGFPYGRGDSPSRGEYNYVRAVDCVVGACFLTRKKLFDELGGFDTAYAPAFYEEFDLAFALREMGFKTIYQPASVVYHAESQSYGEETKHAQSRKNHARFVAKWETALAEQPNRGSNWFAARHAGPAQPVVLMIDDKPPEFDKHAGALTIYQYIQLLLGEGFRVIFCPEALVPLEPYSSHLQQLGVEVLCAPTTLESWLAQNGSYLDYVWTARPSVTAPILDLLRKHTKAKLLYYTHDLHYLREFRRYQVDRDPWALEESQRLKEMEFTIFREVDCVMTPSAEEVKVIESELPGARVREILPYFYEPEPLQPRADFSHRQDMILVGGFDHLPNVDAAVWLVREVLPLVWRHKRDARLLIVGNNPPQSVRDLASNVVDVLGYVPDLQPYFDRARMSVNPLRYGAGIKGKIVSSLRAGVPVITTSVGNEGLFLRNQEDALIADTEAELAAAILDLYRSDDKCGQLALAGLRIIQQRFSRLRAAEVIRQVFGFERCAVCGQDLILQSDATLSHSAEACENCGSGIFARRTADVILAPYRRQGLSSVKAALPYLSRLRVSDAGLFPRTDTRGGGAAKKTQGGVRQTYSSTTQQNSDPNGSVFDLIVMPGWNSPSALDREQILPCLVSLALGGRLIAATTEWREQWEGRGSPWNGNFSVREFPVSDNAQIIEFQRAG